MLAYGVDGEEVPEKGVYVVARDVVSYFGCGEGKRGVKQVAVYCAGVPYRGYLIEVVKRSADIRRDLLVAGRLSLVLQVDIARLSVLDVAKMNRKLVLALVATNALLGPAVCYISRRSG